MTEKIHPAIYGICIYILVSVGRVQELFVQLSTIQLGKIALVLMAIGFIIGGGRYPTNSLFKTKIEIYVNVLFGIIVFSVFISIWKSNSLDYFLKNYITNIILFYLIIKTTTNYRIYRIYTNTLIISGAILAIDTLVNSIGGDRAYVGRTYDPNDLAMVLDTILPFAYIKLFIENTILKKIIIFATIILFVIVILLTGSRGGLIGLSIIMFFLIFIKPVKDSSSRKNSKIIPKLFMVMISTIVIVNVIPEHIWERFATLSDLGSDYNVSAEGGRFVIWEHGLEIMQNSPLGVGIDSFVSAEGRIGGKYKNAHNIYVQVGVEQGVLGLLVFVLLLIKTRGELGRLATYCKTHNATEVLLLIYALRVAFLSFLITSFFLSAAYSTILYLLFALAAALHYLPNNFPSKA